MGAGLLGFLGPNLGLTLLQKPEMGGDLGIIWPVSLTLQTCYWRWEGTGRRSLCYHRSGQLARELFSTHHQTSHVNLAKTWADGSHQSPAQTTNSSWVARCQEKQLCVLWLSILNQINQSQELSYLSSQVTAGLSKALLLESTYMLSPWGRGEKRTISNTS